MKRHVVALVCAVLAMVSAIPSASAGYENFTSQRSYIDGKFIDVGDGDWFEANVKAAYEYGLIDGKTTSSYAPDGNITIAETVKLAACLNSIYAIGSSEFKASHPWYNTYVEYALGNGILSSEPEVYDIPASRAEFAKIFAAALPDEALPQINQIEEGQIPDVPAGMDYEGAVYKLYRAGVITGSGESGMFYPQQHIKRSEAAAIVTRMANPDLRKNFILPGNATKPVMPPATTPLVTEPQFPETPSATGSPDSNVSEIKALTSEEVTEKCMPAVIKIRTYDKAGNQLGRGSGVLMSANGLAATCAHVVNGVKKAVAELSDGTEFDVHIYDMDVTSDIALIRVVGTGLPYLERTEGIENGDKVYALGYPGGETGRVTGGNVVNVHNTDFMTARIETSAMVYSGNSGGALVDSFGRLVGIVSSSEERGTPSFVVPMPSLDLLDHDNEMSLEEYVKKNLPDVQSCYAGLYPVPDFGKEMGARLLYSAHSNGQFSFFYRKSDLNYDTTHAVLVYNNALNQNTFYLFQGDSYTSSAGYKYTVSLRDTVYEDSPAFCVVVTMEPRSQLISMPQGPEAVVAAVAA